MTTRTITLAAVAVLLLAACGGGTTASVGTSDATSPGTAGPETEAEVAESDEPPPFPWEPGGVDEPASVPLDEIVSGGPPPDGIPPIDDPSYVDQDAADEWLDGREPVLLVERDGEARAYPLQILTWHEIVNDELAGEPTLVTYCPLCNSALVFDPVVDGEVLDFGTSGRLWRSNLVMYDRQTRSLWTQFTGRGIVGPFDETELERIPAQIVSWAEVQAQRPDADVLDRPEGIDRPYGSNPYEGYDDGQPFLFRGETGGPLEQMDRVAALGGGADPVAVPLEVLRSERVVDLDVDGVPVVVLWSMGTASALDTSDIAEGQDVGTTGAFSPVVDGQTLTFTADGEQFVDAETGSRWTVLGDAVAGPLEGTSLERVEHDDTFWFVQFAYQPDTRVVAA